MAGVPYLDFLGESPKGAAPPAAPSVLAPLTDPAADARARANIEATRERIAEEKRLENWSAVRTQQWNEQTEELRSHRLLMADPGPAGQAYRARYDAIHKGAGIDWGNLPAGLGVIATGAAIIATAGAAAGAVGIGTAAGIASGATAANKALDKLDAAAERGVSAEELKELGGEAVANLSLPATLKVDVPKPKAAIDAAKRAATTASVAVNTAKTASASVRAAAPKIATPTSSPAKIVTQAASSILKSVASAAKSVTPKASTPATSGPIGGGYNTALSSALSKTAAARAPVVSTTPPAPQLRTFDVPAPQLTVSRPTSGSKSVVSTRSSASVAPPPAATPQPTTAPAPAPISDYVYEGPPPAESVYSYEPSGSGGGYVPPLPPSVYAPVDSPAPLPPMSDAYYPPSSAPPAPLPPVQLGYLVRLDGSIDFINKHWRSAT